MYTDIQSMYRCACVNSLHSKAYALISSKNTTFHWIQWLIPCTSVFFENLIVPFIVYGTWMYIAVKIQEYTNKCTLLQYKVFTIKILGFRHVFHPFLWVNLRECISVFVLKKYITVFTRALHRSLCWANWIQFSPSHHISVKHSLVLFCHYGFIKLTSGWI